MESCSCVRILKNGVTHFFLLVMLWTDVSQTFLFHGKETLIKMPSAKGQDLADICKCK